MKVLEVNNVSKKLGKKQVLDNVSFFLCDKEITGIVGCNGVGKTTLIKVILGLYKIDLGNIRINGYDSKKDKKKALEKVGAIIENPDLYNYLTGRQNLELLSMYYKNINKDKINNLIKLVGLEDCIDTKVKKYSLGMKQRLGIACSLINSPNLLILDEPTNGLDPEGIISLRKILLKLIEVEGVSIFISSHNLGELNNLCNRILFMKEGRIVRNFKNDGDDLEEMFVEMIGEDSGKIS